MAIKAELSEWIRHAESDLQLAIDVFLRFPEQASFHCQQAAEKALKAVFLSKFDAVVKTHELVFLAEKVGAPKEVISDAEFLTQFFLSGRYPGYAEVVKEENSRKAVAAAQRVVSWSKKTI